MKSISYTVIFEPFTERHFIKTFAKKYKGAWDSTLRAMIVEFSLFDSLFLKNTAEIIVSIENVKICKTEFRIQGTKESRHSSGNRCIVAWNPDKQFVSILLVYSKTDLSGSKETAEWKKIIKNNYPVYKNMFR